MNSFSKLLLRGSVIAVAAITIAGCNPKNKSETPPDTGGGTVTVRQEDQFGTAFATAFRADNNSEPKVVNDGDIVAVSLTAEPATIN